MATGCQGPFCHGTGGWCGCNCKCCPPPCHSSIAVYFDCGSPYDSETNPEGCVLGSTAGAMWAQNLNLPGPPQEMPEFSDKPIISQDARFLFGATAGNVSIPCETICVPLSCGGNGLPCCCLELLNGHILSVGNGFVDAPSIVYPDPNDEQGCMAFSVLLNGYPPPVYVQDCQEVVVTLVPANGDCVCTQVDVRSGPCYYGYGYAGPMAFAGQALWKRKVDIRGKIKINPKTGKPLIFLDKKELLRRAELRRRQLGIRRKK